MILRRSHSAHGFSLIEVLISIFVFATGILGLAGMQMKGLGMLSNSNSISFAMLAVNDMADRMRANPVGVFAGDYDSIDGTEHDPSCGTNCTPAQLAQYDAFEINAQVSTELPEAAISVVNSGNNIFTIEVSWFERISELSETKTHRVSFVPYKP